MSNKLRWLWGVVALAAALLAAGGSTAQAEKLIRWKFKPGQTFRYVMNQEQSQNVKIGTTPMTVTVTMNASISQKIDAVDAQGVASVGQTIDRIQMKMSSPQGISLDYDSASEKPPEGLAKLMAPMFDAMVKKPFTMKIDPRGQVSDMKLPQGLLESINKMGGGQMGNMFSEEGIKQMTGMVALAEKAVSQGDTWSHEASMDMPMFGGMKIKTNYRYEGTEKREGKELDKIASTMQMDIAPQKDKPQPFQMKITDQKTEGTIYFDNEAGQLVEYKTTAKMKMNIKFGDQELEQDVVVNQTFKQAPPEKAP